MATKKTDDAAKERLIDSVKTSLNDAESLLREAASSTGDKANELRDRALTSLKRTREPSTRRRTRCWSAAARRRAPPTTTCTTIPGRPSASRA